MPSQEKVLAFDVDRASLASLGEAFPDWEIEAYQGITTGSLIRSFSPGLAELLVVGARAQFVETLGLCRELRSHAGQAQTPLLVLVSPTQEELVGAALAAGAHSCLVLPIHAKEMVSMVSRARAGNRPGHHTLNLDRAQRVDPWQDDGGQG